jgi:hypothetical protein
VKKILPFIFLLVFASQIIRSQNEVKGTIKDLSTNETLIGASVLYAEGKGAVTDIDGNYKLNLPDGEYTLTASYIGYEIQQKKIKVKGSLVVNFGLDIKGKLDEVEIVADVAKNRETPVAFANIDQKKISEELGSRDLPMLLNSTPGVYATEQGGGAGDARINVRGFDQRNVAVMVDGVPFNDMENGQVYWSNWNGIGGITRSMQIQRGLGASKLAIASVGGTINILTKGIDSKPGGQFKQSIGNNNQTLTSFGYNTGNKNGWGLTFSFQYSQGNGWIDQTWNKSFSYFVKIQKRREKHLFSFGVNGAMQRHGQRPSLGFGRPMYYYNRAYSEKQGITPEFLDSVYSRSDNLQPRGINYNYNWGYYYDKDGNKVVVNENTNYYHKPVFNLSDFWSINDKAYLSTTAYLSIGKGGGTVMQNIPNDRFSDGQVNYQNAYNANSSYVTNQYGSNEKKSNTYERSSVNNHIWYGLLSVFNYKFNKFQSLQLGVDGRVYNGYHWQTPTGLLGGDYITVSNDNNQPNAGLVDNYPYQIKKVGDKIGYYYVGKVRWAGIFGQFEHKTTKFSSFVNITANTSFYQRVDYFAKKDLVLSDTTYYLALGYNDTIVRNGNTYTANSSEARTASTPWKKFFTYTIKGGLNYNLTEHQNAFINLGYLVLPPRFVNVFDRNNRSFSDIKNQNVKAIELGYGIRYPKFAANLNLYYTIWENRPPDFTSSKTIYDIASGSNITLYYNINGMNALHKGVELDLNYKLLSYLSIEGVVSIGDWRYTSKNKYTILDVNGQPAINSATNKPFAEEEFDARGVHVSNAAQQQYVLGARFTFLKNAYIKPRVTYFANNYSYFDPTSLNGANAGRDSWKIPNYGMLDAYFGYDFRLTKKTKLGFNLGVINVLNTVYISDAQNNGGSAYYYNGGFNANSATVYFGQGRRWTLAATLNF